eukprot:6173-Heterococcus_DN1.PRE.1
MPLQKSLCLTSPRASMPAVTLPTLYSNSFMPPALPCPATAALIALKVASTGPVPIAGTLHSESLALSSIATVAVGVLRLPASTCTPSSSKV